MSKKLVTVFALLMLMLAVLPMHVFAMSDTTVELPFVVNDIPCTVVIESVGEAPMPDIVEFEDASKGRFVISYSEPNDYRYRVYQKAETGNTVIYDETVYNVLVSVLVDDDGGLYTVTTISIDGKAEKQSQISFTNTRVDKPDDPNPPQTGDNSNLMLWSTLAIASFLGIIVTVLLGRRKEKAE